MEIVDRVIQLIIAICLLIMLYTQYTYVKADWCSEEVNIIRDHLSDIWYMYGLDEVDITK